MDEKSQDWCPKCGDKYQDEDEARFGEPCDQCTVMEREEE